jgi:hypothetical protein
MPSRIIISEKLPTTKNLASIGGDPPTCWHCCKRYINPEDMEGPNFGKGLNPLQKLGSPVFQEYSRHVEEESTGKPYHYWCFVEKFSYELSKKLKRNKPKSQLV